MERVVIKQHRTLDPKTCLNIRDGGQSIMTPEQRQKISDGLKGHPVSPETREKMIVGNLGQKRSAEVRAKVGECSKANWAARKASQV